jgi:GTP cyclohydrolase I
MPKVTTFKPEGSGGLIIDKGYFFSHCEHHCVPFFGDFYYGYIPGSKIIGASKIGRVVDYFSARLQIAERLCKEVIDHIEQIAEPTGSILIMTGRHLCKEMRGLKKYNVPFEVIEARGALLRNDKGCKDEFLSRIVHRI